MGELLREDAAGLCILTLNRPDQLNALSPELFLALRVEVDAIAQSETVACVIIRGAGRSFCAGYDLKARQRANAALPAGFAAETITAIAALPQPVIAAVHGHCFTGGLELALAADFILAAEHTRFGDTHARWEMRAAWGLTQRLPRRVGAPLAKDMMFSGRELSGVEAVQAGLATRWAPDDAIFDLAVDVGRTICERSSPVIRWIKHQVAVGQEMSLESGLAYERENRPHTTAATDERLRSQGWSG